MSYGSRRKRREERKYKRIFVRYGATRPEHKAVAQHLSTRGLFLATNEVVFAIGSPIVIEIASPTETWIARGVVRHSYKVHPNLSRFTKPGMGVELVEVPPALCDYLSSL
jgi:hypothetical protein